MPLQGERTKLNPQLLVSFASAQTAGQVLGGPRLLPLSSLLLLLLLFLMLAVRMRAGHEGGSCRKRKRAGVGCWGRALPAMLLRCGFSHSSQASHPLPGLDEKV